MKKIIFVFCFFAFSSPFFAQNIGEFFVSLPESYLSQLSSDQRRELLDRSKNKKDSTIINNYGGRSRLLAFDDERNYIKVQISEQGFFEAKKWILKDSTFLFATTFWVCAPACDGEISFFKDNYAPAMFGKDQFPSVDVSDFFNRDSLAAKGISEDELKNRFDIFFVRFEFQPDGDDILVINDNQGYMNKEDYEKWGSCLKGDRLRLIWRDGYFEKGN